MLDWFNALEAANVGVALADALSPAPAVQGTKAAGKEQTTALQLQELLQRADRDVRALRFNFYQKAKFANSFKWRLIENGVASAFANEVTQSLIVHLSKQTADPASGRSSPAVSADQPDVGKMVPLIVRANKSLADGNYAEAVTLYQESIALVPHNPDVLNNLGVALAELGRYQEAEQCYREAIEINPEFIGALCNLADMVQGSPHEAEELLRRALKVNPKNADARVKLGIALDASGREREAKTCFKKALKLVPRHPQALLGLGRIARTEGRFDEAETFFKRALKSNPKSPGAWAAMNILRKMTSADGDWLKGAEEIAGSGISLWEEAELRFAIGKHRDDIGDFERAFQNYKRGNELMKTVSPKYDRQAHSRFADDMIRSHTQQALQTVGSGGSASIKPIFVVGMPRSGTSLTEQIIASHPAAKGAGEPEFWLDAARAQQSDIRLGILGEPARKKLAEEYLRVLERSCPDAPRIVDKTPTNSDYLGFMHSVLPNARIIHMRRDPIDTCLSCYFQHFSTGMRFAMDLSDLAEYYRIHQRLMQHWSAALPPGTILAVPYEELVADQEGWTRKILDFLELEWDERCLSFYETKRTVSTASAWQVRQKIYNQSVRRWRNYEKFIGPLKGLRA